MDMLAASVAVSRRSRLLDAVGDLIEGLARWELWSTLGWHDIRQRYRRSIVGPFWLTLSMGVMVAGLAYLYAGPVRAEHRELSALCGDRA